MRKIPILAVAACCLVALPLAGAQAAGDKVPSTLKAKYKGADPSDPYGTSEFSGKVGPKKCAKARKVTIKGVGSTRTAADGRFAIALGAPADPGRYKVKVAAKTKRGLTCKKASKTLTVK